MVKDEEEEATVAERVGENKRQDEPRATKSTRIRVGAPMLFLLALPEVLGGLEKNLILDERAQPLYHRARIGISKLPRDARSIPSVSSVYATCRFI